MTDLQLWAAILSAVAAVATSVASILLYRVSKQSMEVASDMKEATTKMSRAQNEALIFKMVNAANEVALSSDDNLLATDLLLKLDPDPEIADARKRYIAFIWLNIEQAIFLAGEKRSSKSTTCQPVESRS